MGAEAADLDEALADDGEDVILRRMVGIAPNRANVDVTVRAFVRFGATQELLGGVAMSTLSVIISATQIIAAQWPGGQAPTLPPFDPDSRVPLNTDTLIVQGRRRTITAVQPIYLDGELVRINMTAVG
ncbi:MAG: hypothetical protein HXX10_07665 [Rhodoplanes sp.]|uniref:hypothetical protein n=1 Tax=Rhodoplanes sp. TaxID=1968906 RepID=UPI00185AC3C9|nr:hypothetical protein [Rhodoplanes sp.]NVO13898.1 hypothetical protein [Rhodoplanes sp.]